ncbi:MAG: hypothetical protein HYX84_04640 [Chloroflexi bacterium]|nr:hypothetical protein [Chloroflexota bacterium]
MKNGMLEKVIENWLTNTDERTYQVPFCQLLTLKGYKVVHISTHGPFEQGKDIIAIGPEGNPCVFQLKIGDIPLDRWRQIRSEVDELLDIPINHPSIPKSTPHESHFVTTGTFSDPVRREIDDRNEQRKRDNKPVLHTTVKGELLQDFLGVTTEFLPQEIKELQLFLNLYTRDGTCPLPKKDFSDFLSVISPLSKEYSKQALVRAGASSLVFSAYVLSPYERAKNHWALGEGWIVYTAYLMALAEKNNAYQELLPSLDLAISSVERSLADLQVEALESPDLLQGSIFDGMFYPYSTTILCGYLSAYRLYLLLKGTRDWREDRITGFLEKYKGDIRLFGEIALPHFLSIFWYTLKTGEEEKAHAILNSVIKGLVYSNRKQKTGLISPYYEVETIVRHNLGLLNELITESFVDKTFSLGSLIALAARYGRKELLASQWRQISHIETSEFSPNSLWETFLYRAEHGRIESRFPNQTQSWEELVEEAKQINAGEVPVGFSKYPQFALLLLLVFPHRMRQVYIKFLDAAITSA